MPLFLSTITNKVDKKGRVSVPAPFRAALASQGWPGIVCYNSFVHPAIEGCDLSYMERLSESIDEFAPYTDEHEAFATTILAGSVQLSFDSEGRVLIPDALLSHAGIVDRATFVGRGKTFQIWEPEAFADHISSVREVARTRRDSLHLKRSERPEGEGGSS